MLCAEANRFLLRISPGYFANDEKLQVASDGESTIVRSHELTLTLRHNSKATMHLGALHPIIYRAYSGEEHCRAEHEYP
jgi:hypothetical protein